MFGGFGDGKLLADTTVLQFSESCGVCRISAPNPVEVQCVHRNSPLIVDL